MRETLYAAVEAGGTKFCCTAVNTQGSIIGETRIVTRTPAETLDAVLQFLAVIRPAHARYAGVGIAAFGPLDLNRTSPSFGHILATPKPHWSHTDLVTPFATQLDCPVAIDTDVNGAALAEAHYGAGRGCGSVVYVTVGTGIGGGICIDGHTLQGALHPEMGHIRVQRHPDDLVFPGCCPFHGDCLEGLASGTAIVARYGSSLDQLPASHPAHSIIADYLGQLAATVTLLLSPHKLIFGGGVMTGGALLAGMRHKAATLFNGYAGLGQPASSLDDLIVAPVLGDRAGIQGALLLAQRAAANSQRSL